MKGCHGMAVAFSTQSIGCANCADRKTCANIVKESLVKIHQETDVTDFLQSLQRAGVNVNIVQSNNSLPRQRKGRVKAKKNKVPTITLDLISHLPKGANAIAKKMLSIEPELENAIKQNINPFNGIKPSYIAPVFDLIIAGNISKETIASSLINSNPSWSSHTVRSHFHSITNALVGLDLIVRDGTAYAPKELQ